MKRSEKETAHESTNVVATNVVATNIPATNIPVTNYFSLWRSYASARVRSELQYRTSFAFGIAAQCLVTISDLIAIWVVFQSTRSIGGWHARDVLWLYAISMTAFGIADLFVSAIEELPEHIRTGKFDSYLLRPTPILLAVVADGFELRRFGRCVPGVASMVLLVAKPSMFGLDGSGANVLWSLLAVVIGAWIYSALFVITNSIAFWLIDSREVANAFTYGGAAASHYPLDILSLWIKRLYVWVIPIGFVAWLPGTRVLDVPKARSLPRWLSLCSPGVAIVLTLVSVVTWRFGIRRYESTGS
jgi:ABC-2 type transport system permease protein